MTELRVRSPVVAGQFYAGSRAGLEKAVAECTAGYQPPEDMGEVIGGVVPHAGWMYSGPTAARVLVTLAEKARPETFILFGAAHHCGVRAAAIFPDGAWSTPLGELPVDGELAAAIAEAGRGLIELSAEAHDMEHSIEVQLPFIQVLCPRARIVPIAVPPVADAVRVGETAASVVNAQARKVVVVASTDLTHYGMGYGVPDHGPLPKAGKWMCENDRRMIRLIESLRAEDVIREAEAQQNACGAGAVAAATAAARALGASSGIVLEYTTSAAVTKETYADRAVGYVAIVYAR